MFQVATGRYVFGSSFHSPVGQVGYQGSHFGNEHASQHRADVNQILTPSQAPTKQMLLRRDKNEDAYDTHDLYGRKRMLERVPHVR